MPKDRIAIIGIGCRFPGGINDPESFWKLLVEGREASERRAAGPVERRAFLTMRSRASPESRSPGAADFSSRSTSSIRSFSASRRAKRRTSIRSTGCCSRRRGRRSRMRASCSISRKGPTSACSSAFRTTIIRASRARRGITRHQRRTRRPAARTASPPTASPIASICADRASRWTPRARPR